MDGFEAKYGSYYKVIRKISIDRTFIVSGESVFYDNRACAGCNERKTGICTKEEILKVSHKSPLTKVDLEKFFNQFEGRVLSSLKDKCDLLLYDSEKKRRIAFCELTCSQRRYVEPYDDTAGSHPGKRAKAWKQLKSSIDKLATVPDIASAMDRYGHKSAIFAVRYKDSFERKSSMQISYMLKFIELPNNIQRGTSADIGNGFLFEVIKYPTIYRW